MPDTYGGEDGPGNPSGVIRALISEGENQTNGYDIFHAAGGHMQEGRFNALYQEVFNTVVDRPDQLGLDPFSPPGAGDYETWELGRGGQFATQVQLQVVDRETGELLTKLSTFVTDEPHTAADAEADAF